jgi:hypothetical protein
VDRLLDLVAVTVLQCCIVAILNPLGQEIQIENRPLQKRKVNQVDTNCESPHLETIYKSEK